MTFEDLLGRIIIFLFFFGGSIIFFIFGLQCLGIIKPKKINSRKWTKTIAKITGSKIVTAKSIGKSSSQYEQFIESTIVYKANNVVYKKYVRNLTKIPHRICIYYKNKNPNYFKLESDVKKNYIYRQAVWIFSLLFKRLYVYIRLSYNVCYCIIDGRIRQLIKLKGSNSQ